MDLRIATETIQIKEIVDRGLSRLNTAIPGEISSFDAATQTVTVIPAIRMKLQIDGVTTYVDLPPIINAPIVFPFVAVAGFALTVPVRTGDPCLIIFSQRAVDSWFQLGGIQNPEEGPGVRHHDLTDAFVLLAPSPSPDVLGAWEANGIEIRNRDKNTHVTVRDHVVVAVAGPSTLTLSDDGTVVAVAPAGATIDAPLTLITGNLQVAGGITSTGTYGDSGGRITTPGDIESTSGDVMDQVRSMAADRDIYNGHTHGENDNSGTTDPPNQEQ
jgi:hypothetical protein